MGLVLALNPEKRYRGVTVPSATWGGKRNGRLSALAAIVFIQVRLGLLANTALAPQPLKRVNGRRIAFIQEERHMGTLHPVQL
jgi:hypothetical protein